MIFFLQLQNRNKSRKVCHLLLLESIKPNLENNFPLLVNILLTTYVTEAAGK